MELISAFIFILFAEILKADRDDGSVFLIDEEDPDGNKHLPNSHSAAMVMGLILLCVLAYGAYRLYRRKCSPEKSPLTVTVEDESGLQGLEEYMREREAYLAIYGPKNTVSSISGSVSRTESILVCPTR